MRNQFLFAALTLLFSFQHVSAQDNMRKSPPEELRVRKSEAAEMRGRRKDDDATFKISREDLESLITSSKAANDTFIFFLVKYDRSSPTERARYRRKVPGANFDDIAAKKPSSLLVGFISGNNNSMGLVAKPPIARVAVYDLAIVCPPPPNCDCEIAQ